MPREDANIPPSKRKAKLPQYSLRFLFWLTLVAAVYAALATSVEWRNNLAWPNQLWALLLVAVVVGLVFATRGEAIPGVLLGFFLINVPYLPIWWLLYLFGQPGTEVLWYIVYAGVHGAGLLGGTFAIVKRYPIAGGTTLAIMALSMALNCVVCHLMGLPVPPLQIAHPPNILPGQY